MQPLALILPVVYAIFLWWFTTGLIMIVYDRAQWIQRLYFLLATLILCMAFAGLALTRHDTSSQGVYIAITCGIVLWGWQVASYYLGFITGPDDLSHLVPGRVYPLATRFWLALRASLYHELCALAFALLMGFMLISTDNPWGLGIYLALWLMHTSAKLNIFFGVRNFRIEFLPQHLHRLELLLCKTKYNLFFPFSVVLASSIALSLIYQGIIPPADAARMTGSLALATLLTLGVLEHLLLVLPVPSMLWGWGVRDLPEAKPETPVEHHVRPVVPRRRVQGQAQRQSL